MARIDTHIRSSSATFARNFSAYAVLRENRAQARGAAWLGGGSVAQARQLAKGKLFARQRVGLLLDPGTPFFEIELCGNDQRMLPFPEGAVGRRPV